MKRREAERLFLMVLKRSMKENKAFVAKTDLKFFESVY